MQTLGESVVRVGVVGTGYLGAVHAACMATLGHEVVGVDVDSAKIERLSAGEPPFYEPGLRELLRQVLPKGALRFTTNMADLAHAQVVFLCLGTPQAPDGRLDLRSLTEAVVALGPHLSQGALVVGKSTVPVGTAEALTRVLTEVSHGSARLAWNPEFLREGRAIEDTLKPSRLVYGIATATADEDATILDRVYARMLSAGVPRLITDLATAELVKGAANAFLATKISFINSVADICEAAGADVTDLAQALGYDDRIGPAFLGAGLGFGGGCLPKDIRGFAARASELGVPRNAELLAVVDRINHDRRIRVVEQATALLSDDLKGKRIAVLGFAFKPDSDDVRDSAALDVAEELARRGAIVRLHDPRAVLPAKSCELHQVAQPQDAVDGSDLVLHLTEWSEYQDLDPDQLAALTDHPTILDARNQLGAEKWEGAGWTYVGMGRAERSLGHVIAERALVAQGMQCP